MTKESESSGLNQIIAEQEGGDLLRANPNHLGGGWVDTKAGSEEEVDDVETLVDGFAHASMTSPPNAT